MTFCLWKYETFISYLELSLLREYLRAVCKLRVWVVEIFLKPGGATSIYVLFLK
jgi:hypothetical protein